jgi:hypothetical protein
VCHTIHKALADAEAVPEGLNQRHPDFAALAVRLGRAMGREAEAVAALRAAEADKSLFNLENDTVGVAVLEAMRGGESFNGTAAELMEKMKAADPSLDSHLSAKRLSKRLQKLWPHLAAVLSARQEVGHGGALRYTFQPPGPSGAQATAEEDEETGELFD